MLYEHNFLLTLFYFILLISLILSILLTFLQSEPVFFNFRFAFFLTKNIKSKNRKPTPIKRNKRRNINRIKKLQDKIDETKEQRKQK